MHYGSFLSTLHYQVDLENLIEAADGIKFVYGSGGCAEGASGLMAV